MELIRFTDKLSGKDPTQSPYKLRAQDLDDNFRRLRPIAQDGNTRQYAIEETPDGWSLKLFPDATSTNPLTLLEGMAIIEIERCDGKKMQVVGTGWYD